MLNVFSSRDKTVLLTLFFSLVRPVVEYCCQLWDPVKIKQINEIEQIQRQFTRKIGNLKELDYWSRLNKLEIMSLQRRREMFIIILVWKIKNNLIPNDINLEFKRNTYNSNIKAVLKPMPRVTGKLLSLHENSFLIKASKLWNKLPQDVSEVKSFNVFRTKLEKFLKSFPDKPPVCGYYHQNDNSILSYGSGIGGSSNMGGPV